MFLYIILISIGVLGITSVNLIGSFQISVVFDVFLIICIATLPSILISILLRVVPKGFFNPDRRIFHVFKFEKILYEKLRIKRWKEKIPELGRLSHFPKDKIYDPRNPEYLRVFLQENCFAEFLHISCIIWGFVSLLFVPEQYLFSAGIPVVVINLMLHLLPIVVQRHLRLRLVNLLHMVEKRMIYEGEEVVNEEIK